MKRLNDTKGATDHQKEKTQKIIKTSSILFSNMNFLTLKRREKKKEETVSKSNSKPKI
jgi:hypothetical protein